MNAKRYILMIFCLGLIGCSSQRMNQARVTLERKPTPPAIRYEYLKSDDLRRVRSPEFVKTYFLGRTTSPDGSIMHEAHRVYRVEKSAGWNLARTNPPLRSKGPVERLMDSQFRPMPSSQELRAELTRQKETTAQLEAARQRLEAALRETKERLNRTSAIDPTVELMRREMEKLEKNATKEQAPKVQDLPPDSNELRQWGEKQQGKP